jgi:hypothetical protein
MFNVFSFLVLIFIFSINAYSSNEAELKKSHLEDIFIWKISDELKLTAKQEKQFTEISKSLNKKKSELNKKIQEAVQNLKTTDSETQLKSYKKLIQEYNQISITEFDDIKKILGAKKFVSYLKIKNELNTKLKSILVGDKLADNKRDANAKPLPSPKVIIERSE